MIDSSELEEAIVGCILMHGDLYKLTVGLLGKEDFYNNTCSIIYGSMISLDERGRTIDPVMVVSEIRRSYSEKEFPAQLIYELANESPNGHLFEEYVDELIETRGIDFEANQLVEKEVDNE